MTKLIESYNSIIYIKHQIKSLYNSYLQLSCICLGLDMLYGHQCTIDLIRNVLYIGTTGTEIAFLPEAELPKLEKADNDDNDAGITKAVEESIREDLKNKGGSSLRNSKDKNKKPKLE